MQHLFRRQARTELHAILHVSGYDINDIINDEKVRAYILWEWHNRNSVKRYLLGRRQERETVAAAKYKEAIEYWKMGVLAPWEGGPGK